MPGLGVGTAAGAERKGRPHSVTCGAGQGVRVRRLGEVGGTGSPQWGEGTGRPSGGQRDREISRVVQDREPGSGTVPWA